MIKKCLIVLMAVIIVFTIGIAVAGCNKKYEEINVIDAYSEVMSKIIKGKNIDLTNPLAGEVAFKLGIKDIKNTEKTVDLHIKASGNLNLTPTGKNEDNNFIINILNHNDNDKKLLGVYSDGNFLYIDSEKSHYKIENFKIYDLLKGNDSKHLNSIASVSSVLAGLFFDKAEVDGGKYIFHYNLGNVLNNIKSLIQQDNSIDTLNNIAKSLHFDDWNDIYNKLSPVVGRLEYHFTADKLTSSNWFTTSKTHEFYLKTGGFKLINDKYNFDFPQLLSGKEWVTTKLLNITAQGELHFKEAGTSHAKYTWELRSNLDMFELMANKGNFNLDKDDMAHFIIRNNLSDNSAAFNNSRIKSAGGVIFELAYDPQQLGTNNVLMAINLKALLPKSLASEFNLPAVAFNMIPQYYGMYIDNDIIAEIILGFNGEHASELSNNLKHGLVNMLKKGINLNSSAIDSQSDSYKLLNIIAAVGDKKIDNIDFKINKFSFADMANKEYKLSEHFLGIADQETAESKDFGEALGFIPSKASTPIIIDGKAAFYLDDGTIIKSGDKLSEQQLNKIVGGSVEYTYTGFDGATYIGSTPVKIIAVTGLDLAKFGQSQTIKLITSPPDGKNLLGFLTAIDAIPSIPTNVYSFDVILTK